MSSYGSSRPDEVHLRQSPSERSPSLPATALQQQQQQDADGHRRVYQACIPCRRRKVRCDLGSVDNPHDPPCVRCRRESKECFFSATRRKRKTDGDSIDSDDYVVRNGRRKIHADTVHLYGDAPVAPPSGIRSQPLRRPQPDARSAHGRKSGARDVAGLPEELNTPLENLEAQSVMRQQVYGPHDALDLLYKAATDGPYESKTDDTSGQPSTSTYDRPNRSASVRTASTCFHLPGGSGHLPHRGSHAGPRSSIQADPSLGHPDPSTHPGYAEALMLWSRFRFVRAGWFTAQEAMGYIDYYYKYLSPLTPISPPTFNNPTSHVTLLNEEPILAVTLLTIASRYKSLAGPGATCRSHAIHEQLWTYLRGMIERVVWGQEAFGGGFCGYGGPGADESQTSSTAPWRGLRKGSLRTLGTIESLMILTEWHPRALHFPPAEVTDELLLPAYTSRDSADPSDPSALEPGGDQRPVGVGGKRIDSWLEPAWRSDRMCWMLLSTAMGLAYELGVFDDIDELLAAGAITRPEYEEETYRLRAYRIKRLLLIYLTQLAGRLGWTTMVPESLRKKDSATSRRRPNSSVDPGQTPGTAQSSTSTAFNYIPDLELDDQIIHCWVGISNAMHAGNEKLFRSRKHTTEIIQSGQYIELLKEFQPLLKDWWKEFERFRLPPYIRYILTIEFEYVRIYVNSLSLQAVVERSTSHAGNAGLGGAADGNGPQQLSPQTQNYYGELPLGQLGGFGAADREYVKEVVSGCRNLLDIVVNGLLPDGYLKHAPVRTYFRIISGAMFLLKTFALGAPRADVKMSLELMDRTVDALRNCVVDDVHLGTRFADLLESLTSRLRNRFKSAPPPENHSPNPHPPSCESAGPVTNGQPSSHVPAAPPRADHGSAAWSKVDADPHPGTEMSATPFDPATGHFPYSSGPATVLDLSTPGMSAGLNSAVDDNLFSDNTDWYTNDMWYLPTGPALFQNVGDSNVTMTAEGVSVAGLDLLDFMAMDA